MKLVKVLAVLGVGLYFGFQPEWSAMLAAKYEAVVGSWARVKVPALPAEITPLVSQSATP